MISSVFERYFVHVEGKRTATLATFWFVLVVVWYYWTGWNLPSKRGIVQKRLVRTPSKVDNILRTHGFQVCEPQKRAPHTCIRWYDTYDKIRLSDKVTNHTMVRYFPVSRNIVSIFVRACGWFLFVLVPSLLVSCVSCWK